MLKKDLEKKLEEINLELFTQNVLLEAASTIIAEAGGGNWDTETRAWKKKATEWRDRYSEHLRDIIAESGEKS